MLLKGDEGVSDDFRTYFREVRGLKTALAALGLEATPTQMVERVLMFIALATEQP
jgi:hypothetical protein